MKKILIIAISIIMVSVFVVAAYTVDKVRMSKGEEVVFSTWGTNYKPSNKSQSDNKNQSKATNAPIDNKNEPSDSEDSKMISKDIVLYFPDTNILNLIGETRTVKVSGDSDIIIAETIINEIIKGPENEELISVIPAGTYVNSVKCDEPGVCVIDLNDKFTDFQDSGSSVESLAIMSFVNSLCEIEGVDKVKININGNENATLSHCTLEDYWTADLSLIKQG